MDITLRDWPSSPSPRGSLSLPNKDHMGPKAGEHEGHMGSGAGEHEGHMGPRTGQHEGHMGPRLMGPIKIWYRFMFFEKMQ